MPLSKEALLSVARQYWRSDKDFDFILENSPEAERFLGRWAQELEHMDQWRAFLRDLGSHLPGFNIGNITATCDASFRCSVYPRMDDQPRVRHWVVVGCVSILAPVYTIYGVRYGHRSGGRASERLFFGDFPSEMQAPAELIARRLEATFKVSALPREIAETPIPLIVEPQEPPDTTLFHALFISDPERVP